MIWVIGEIVIPLLAMLILGIAVGLSFGWFLWRWRRQQISAEEWDHTTERLADFLAAESETAAALRESETDYKLQSEQLDAARAEIEALRKLVAGDDT